MAKQRKISVEEFERNHQTMHFNKFADYLWALKLTFWELAQIKNELGKKYQDKSLENDTHKLVVHLYYTRKQEQLESYEAEIEKKLTELSDEEKVKFLKEQVEGVKKKWYEYAPERYRERAHISFSTSFAGEDRTILEPHDYFNKIGNWLEHQIEHFKREIRIQNTPILHDLHGSLHNFTFEEWHKRASAEAPEPLDEKLAYYVTIKSDIQRWEDDNQKKGHKANFFTITRYRKFSKDRDIEYGPMSNFLRYINWCDVQLDLIKQQMLIKNTQPPQTAKSFSFQYLDYLTGSSNLTNLHNSLIKNELIDKATKIGNFRKIFSGEEIKAPIIWTGHKSELAYFIKLIHTEYRRIKPLKHDIWKVTAQCFIKPSGSKFTSKELKDAKTPTTADKLITVARNL